jgi:hypothetical protein
LEKNLKINEKKRNTSNLAQNSQSLSQTPLLIVVRKPLFGSENFIIVEKVTCYMKNGRFFFEVSDKNFVRVTFIMNDI